MTYKEARVYLDQVSKYGSVLGLDTIRNLLNELGNPQDKLKFIHIAGTNGKGSILSFISSILTEAGYRTGRYSSPSVLAYLEMIQIDERWISEEEFAKLVGKVKKAIARMETKGQSSPTIFEVETAIAFLYFYEKNCDYVVLETGLGGSEDATNVINNTEAAVFASISFDHMGILGNTLEEIAEAKSGIIKPGCIVISAKQRPEAERVLRNRAEKMGCQIIFAEPEKVRIEEESYKEIRFCYKDIENVKVHMTGQYQIENAATVLELMRTDFITNLSKASVKSGMENAKWTGRFTCINDSPVFIIDGAHNEAAARKLCASMKKYFPEKKLSYICGVFKDKEYEKIAQIMAPFAEKIYTVNLPNKERTLNAEVLCEVMRKYCSAKCKVESITDTQKAVEKMLRETGKDEVILAFGSLSYLNEIIEYVRKNVRG